MSSLFLLLAARATNALALQQRILSVDTGFKAITFPRLITNIINFLVGAIAIFCLTLFLVGAYHMVVAGENETRLGKGKDLMLGSLIGLAVGLSAYAVVRTVFYIIFFG
jgi:large-conductance mechanosensitive channel